MVCFCYTSLTMTVKRGVLINSRTKTKKQTRITTKQRKQRRKNARRAVCVSALLCLVISVIYMLNLSQFRIGQVVIKGVKTLDFQVIESQVLNELDKKVWFVLPKDSVFWYGKLKLRGLLLEAYPALDSVEIDLQKIV